MINNYYKLRLKAISNAELKERIEVMQELIDERKAIKNGDTVTLHEKRRFAAGGGSEAFILSNTGIVYGGKGDNINLFKEDKLGMFIISIEKENIKLVNGEKYEQS